MHAGSPPNAPGPTHRGPACPRDGSALAQQQVGDVVLDYCPSCAGLFFDAGELEQLEGRSPRLHMSHKKPTDETPLCVRCATKMEPYSYSGRLPGASAHRYGVEVDYCPKCQSYWLDGGEFRALRSVLEKEESGHIRFDDVSIGQYVLMLLTSMPLEYNVAPTRRAWVTISLLVANVLVYLAGVAACALDSSPEQVSLGLGLVPDQLGLTSLYMLLTYQFAHGGIIHLAGNMYFLYVYGDNLEDRWGRGIYLLAYLIMGICAGLAHALLTTNGVAPLVGASGAISGLIGAYLVTFPKARMGCLLVFVPVRVTVLIYSLVWFGMQAVGVLAEQAMGTSFPVSVSCHAGGFVVGVLVGLVLRRRGATPRKGS